MEFKKWLCFICLFFLFCCSVSPDGGPVFSPCTALLSPAYLPTFLYLYKKLKRKKYNTVNRLMWCGHTYTNQSELEEEDEKTTFPKEAFVCIKMLRIFSQSVGVSALYFALVFFRSLGRGSWSRKTDQEIWLRDWLHFWNCCGEEVAEQTVLHHGQFWPPFAALSSLTEWFSFAAPKKDKETFHAITLCDVNPILKLFGLLCKM